MIILEYLILASILVVGLYLWDVRLRILGLQDTHDRLIIELQNEFEDVSTKKDLDSLDRILLSLEEERKKDQRITWDRFDDFQRTVLTKTEFDKYLKDLREKEAIINESQKKLKENRNKSLRIAFGGKDDE